MYFWLTLTKLENGGCKDQQARRRKVTYVSKLSVPSRAQWKGKPTK